MNTELTAELRTVDLATLTDRWYEETGDIPGLIALNIQEPGFGPAGIPGRALIFPMSGWKFNWPGCPRSHWNP